jgi:hypothetical protein
MAYPISNRSLPKSEARTLRAKTSSAASETKIETKTFVRRKVEIKAPPKIFEMLPETTRNLRLLSPVELLKLILARLRPLLRRPFQSAYR